MLHNTDRRLLLLASRDMQIALPARAVSFLGDAVTFVVLLLKVGELNRPILVSALLAAFSLPLFALAPVAGRIVDEFDSRHVLVVAGSAQAAASLGLAFAPGFTAIIVWLLLLQTAQAVTGPAWAALVPRMVAPELIGRAVGVQQSLAGIAGLGGSAVGGVLYDLVGYTRTMLIDTATFTVLVAAAVLVRARRGRRYDAARAAGAAKVEEGVASRTVGGLGVIRADDLLRLLVPALCLFVVGLEAVNVVEVFLVRGPLGGSPTDYGLISAAFMLGQIAGPMLAARANDDRQRVTVTAAAAGALAALIVGAGLSPSVWWLYPLYAAGGVAGGVINGAVMTLVVTRVADDVRGRVLAVLTGVTRGCSALAMVAGGLMGQYLGARTTFVVCGAISGVVALIVLRARVGAADARRSRYP